jgi:hypothetical protein
VWRDRSQQPWENGHPEQVRLGVCGEMESGKPWRWGTTSECVLGVWRDGSQQPWKKRHPEPVHLGVCGEMEARDIIHQIVIRTLAGFCYLCQQLVYLVLGKIFLIASEIGDLLGSYQDYPTKSVSKQGAQVKS